MVPEAVSWVCGVLFVFVSLTSAVGSLGVFSHLTPRPSPEAQDLCSQS
jgi:hypothetical protein